MGRYLNPKAPFVNYKNLYESKYFIDKSDMLERLFSFMNTEMRYLCITRPRRFGKTVMANMLGAFFCREVHGRDIFDHLKIAKSKQYETHINHHNVIYIDFSEIPSSCDSYEQYILRIEKKLKKDLQNAYPQLELDENEAPWDMLSEIFEELEEENYIFIMDEWDYIFHKDFVTEKDKEKHIVFLNNLLKGKAYVSLVYMTGILPIAKYSSGSELNVFAELTMGNAVEFSGCFGFTEAEVDYLYEVYRKECANPTVSREGIRTWYDGYHTASGESVYNPRSVVYALQLNRLESYWTNSGPYDEIFFYVKNNIADVRNDLALLVAWEAIEVRTQEYAAVSMELVTREEIFSAMVVYGFLSEEKGRVRIPNKELMDKFSDMLRKESSLGYIYRLARESERMLAATLAGDTKIMAEIIAHAHDTETPILTYNHETELSAIVNLVYLSARDTYLVEREDRAGKGYVDFIFYPVTTEKPGIILELKVNDTPQNAIQQVKDKKYALAFKGKMAEKHMMPKKILAVGIGYDKETKEHCCLVEEIRH